MIVKKKDGYYVLADDGENLGGPYADREQAEKRSTQVALSQHVGLHEHAGQGGSGGRELEPIRGEAGAKLTLTAALARQERYLNGTEEVTEKGQRRMYDDMKAALAEIEGKKL